ncbi:uncharacterized protein EI90DRAFT_3061549, partial [Cantharellus anzutake]|uniref:uncharacterized protein n=1 Tax=Cantharellus anzutake TaxID=1750568 RepID=UPI001905292F
MTNVINATATFIFKGTGIWVYGAKRQNHGNYFVNLDGAVSEYSGYSPIDTFQNVLFGRTDLAPELHSLSVTNGGSDHYFDIDYIIWEAIIADYSTSLLVDDSSRFDANGSVLMFEYLPSQSLWDIGTFDNGSYDDTISSTNTNYARTSIVVPSTADAVAVYGKVGPSHGSYACGINKTIVDPVLQTMNGNAGLFSDDAIQQLLCYFLGLGDHLSPTLLTIANNINSASLSIDYVEVWGSSLDPSTPFIASTTAARTSSRTASPTQNGSSKSTSTNVGSIVGGTVGCLVVITVALIATFIFYRRRQRKRDITPRHRDVTETMLGPVFDAAPYPVPYYASVLRDIAHLTNPPTRPSDEHVSSSGLVRQNSRTLSEWTAPASQTTGSPQLFDRRRAIIPRNGLGYDPSPLL